MSGLSEIRSHTGLRGVAALLVVALHYKDTLHSDLEIDSALPFLGGGGAFVDLFFILSGFVLFASYRHVFAGRVRMDRAWDFWMRRFARIYPLHFATLAFMLVFSLWRGHDVSVSDLVQNLTLTHAWDVSEQYVLNPPSWSISAEMFLYLLCPALIVLVTRSGGPVIVLMLVTGLYALLFLWGNGFDFDERTALLRGLPSFMLGMVLAKGRHLTRGWSDAALGAVQVAAVAGIAMILHHDWGQPMLAPLFAALILTTEADRGVLARVLGSSPVHTLGLWSFAIYLLHMPVMYAGFVIGPKLLPMGDPVLYSVLLVACAFAITILAAPLCYRRFEMASRAWIMARATPRRHAVA